MYKAANIAYKPYRPLYNQTLTVRINNYITQNTFISMIGMTIYEIQIVFTENNFRFDKDVNHTHPINVFLDTMITENEVRFIVANASIWFGEPPIITLYLDIEQQDELKLFKPEKHKELLLSAALLEIDKAYKKLLIEHLEKNKVQILRKITIIRGRVFSIKDMHRYISFKEIFGFPINQSIFYEIGLYLEFLTYNKDDYIHYQWKDKV